MINARTIIELSTAPNTDVNRGKAMHRLEEAKRDGSSPAVIAMLQELVNRPVPKAETYQHPSSVTRPPAKPIDGLSPADISWIDRLPRDPEKISYQDACTLATLSQYVSPTKNPSEARLIASVWEPVKHLHDRRASEVALQTARTPLPAVPPGTLGALQTAIRTEYPNLNDDAVRAEASSRLSQVTEQRAAAHAKALTQAETAAQEMTAGQANHGVTDPRQINH